MKSTYPRTIINNPKGLYCINRHFLTESARESLRRAVWEFRFCILEPDTRRYPHHNDVLFKFTCRLPKHDHKYNNGQRKYLQLTPQQILEIGRGNHNGGLLVSLKKGVCHKCGTCTWCGKSNVEHPVCVPCFNGEEPLAAPFPYGKLNSMCCSLHGCGDKAHPGMKENMQVLRRALEIQKASEAAAN